jgi:penicillin-binding protein 1B
MPRKTRTARQRKPRSWLRRIVVGTFVAGAVVAALLLGYVIYLDRLITGTFEGRRWTLPARVYAQPLELYLGRRLRAEDLSVELRRLGYRAATSGHAGTFFRRGNEMHIHTRAFTFDDGPRAESELSVRFAGSIVAALTQDDRPAELVSLDAPMIGSFFPTHGEDRLVLTPEETPRLLTEGLKVVEDRNFDRHVGFDPEAILRAIWVNLRAGGIQQGGSTLTQQLVKSYFLDNRQTVTRKLKEVVMAVIIDARFEKADILNAYVNEIFLGQDGNRAVHGFGLGSQFYFNKPLSELDAAEIALLITVIRGPSYYNPFRHAERARERRDRVLAQMRDFALLTEAEYRAAVKEPLDVVAGNRRGGSYYPAYLELVRDQLAQSYDADDLATQGLRIFTTLEPWVQDAAEAAVTETLDVIERERGLEAGKLESAIVVTRTQTGEVSALVGGRKASEQGFNRALNAKRPVGSVLKPVVYLAALESGQFDLSTIVDDAPIVVPDRHTGDWSPKNYDDVPHGPVPLVRALGDSLNLATVRVGMQVGVDRVAERLGELLDRAPPPAFPSLLLGAIDLTPMDVTRLYGTFASGGFETPPKSIISVEDETGATVNRYPLAVEKVAEPDTVAVLEYGLQTVMLRGTGERSRWSGHGVAGKTGTTDDNRDSWFAGFDANYLAVVWVGYDDNSPSGLSGTTGALRVWDRLMGALQPSPVTLPVPYGMELRSIDYDSGMGAVPGCGDPVSVPLPYNVAPPMLPGCGGVLDRIRSWFE